MELLKYNLNPSPYHSDKQKQIINRRLSNFASPLFSLLGKLLPVVAITMLISITTTLTEAATFTVTQTGDGGIGSLRQAILDANTNVGLDNIHFNIPAAGPHTIQPLTVLPAIADPVVIDGSTQPGANCSVWPPTLMIELDGTNVFSSSTRGLILEGGSSGSTIRGLVINRFGGNEIRILQSDNSHIECNFVGTDISGNSEPPAPDGNITGILVLGSIGVTIGGASASARNLVSGNGNGIRMSGGDETRVLGNFIGTDVSGTQPLGNSRGIEIFNSDNCTIGGTGSGEGNIIAFNDRFNGVEVRDPSSGNSINNAILGNKIFANTRLGIDLNNDGVTANDASDADTGPNNLQNFPVITSATLDSGVLNRERGLQQPGKHQRFPSGIL